MQDLYQYQSTAVSTSEESSAFRLLQAVKVKQCNKSRKTAENDK
jgi:chitodextrinase